MIGDLHADEIEQILLENHIGRLGCTDGHSVYVIPISYIYDGRSIIAHSTEGRKIHYMRQHPEVCFEVDQIDNIVNWRSVLVWGRYEEVNNEMEKQKIMEEMAARTMKLKVTDHLQMPHLFEDRPRPHQPGYVQVVIWRIAINKKSGRFEKNI